MRRAVEVAGVLDVALTLWWLAGSPSPAPPAGLAGPAPGWLWGLAGVLVAGVAGALAAGATVVLRAVRQPPYL